MDNTRYALVNKKTGLVDNIVVYHEDHLVDIVPDFEGVASPGDTWNGTMFVKPVEPAPVSATDSAVETL